MTGDVVCVPDNGETSWLLFSTVLVLGMMPGLGLFEAGLLRSYNTVSILTQVFAGLSACCVLWYVIGYSLVFGSSWGGVIGDISDHPMFLGLSANSCYPGTRVPELLFALFQMMFAAITPLLLTGAFAERLVFKPFVAFIILWEVLVYYPVAHWVWGDGWLARIGTVDFAGGLVVHVTAGVAAIVTAVRLKPREHMEPPPSNVAMACVGGVLLLMGWFGFNGGSTLGNMDLAVVVAVNNQVASSVSGLVWMIISWTRGTTSAVDILNGCIVGLAGITPVAGYITSRAAFVVGAILGLTSYGGLWLIKHRLKVDDALDVSSVHGIPGLVGLLATGFAASTDINSEVDNGLLFGGNGKLLGAQVLGIVVVSAYTAVITRLILLLVRRTLGRMVRDTTEADGLDRMDHAIPAYTFSGSRPSMAQPLLASAFDPDADHL